MQASEDFVLSATDRFRAKDGLFIAAAITEYSKDTTPIEKPEFGELFIEQYGWGNEDLGYSYGSRPIPNHSCSQSELGISDVFDYNPNLLAFPVVPQQLNEVKTYSRKFKCISPEDTVIWGDYNTEPAMQISIKFKMCEGENFCKPKEEILDWLRGKYIVFLYNQIVFHADEFG